jgi:hypothetical protein
MIETVHILGLGLSVGTSIWADLRLVGLVVRHHRASQVRSRRGALAAGGFEEIILPAHIHSMDRSSLFAPASEIPGDTGGPRATDHATNAKFAKKSSSHGIEKNGGPGLTRTTDLTLIRGAL